MGVGIYKFSVLCYLLFSYFQMTVNLSWRVSIKSVRYCRKLLTTYRVLGVGVVFFLLNQIHSLLSGYLQDKL